jgi:hypothetical protein
MMTEKEIIKGKILESVIQRDIQRFNKLDKLEFLVDDRDRRINQFELSESIKLKNSWRKKGVNYLIIAIITAFLTYTIIENFDFGKWWSWLILLFMIAGAISFFVSFFENRIILQIDLKGLTLNSDVFHEWKDIEYLYYKTVYDGDGGFDGLYLVEKLKNGHEHEVKVDNLPWTKEKLGLALYQYMKRHAT